MALRLSVGEAVVEELREPLLVREGEALKEGEVEGLLEEPSL